MIKLIIIATSLAAIACTNHMKSPSASSGSSVSNGDMGGGSPLVTPMPVPSPTGMVRQSPNPGQWVNVTSNLAGMASECGNMTYVSSKPSEDLMIAGIAQQGLWGSSDGGASWRPLGTGAGSAQITNRPITIVFDPIKPNTFYEAGIYNSSGVYRSDNSGLTFSALGNINHTDSVSVDFSDPNRQTLLAGAHEQSQKIFRSQDGGQTWTNVGVNLPAGTGFSSFPFVVNSRTFFAGMFLSYGGGTGGIYQSNDAGTTWNLVSQKGGATPPLVASDGSLYWSSDDGTLVHGVGQGANWTFTPVVGPGTLRNHTPVELPDGRLASLSSQRVMISADRGLTWQSFGPPLPFNPTGIAYSNFDRAFYIWQFDCGNKVLPNAIMKLWL